MNNKLPIKIRKDNMIKKFFNYIKKILNKKVMKKDINELEESSITEMRTKINELYKVENLDKVNWDIINKANKQAKIEEIVQIIKKEPDILKKLSIPQLEIIAEYYKEKLKKYRKKLL